MIVRVSIERIFDNPFQTRQGYAGIEDLAASIQKMRAARPETSGLIQVPPARIVIQNGREAKVLDPAEYGGVEPCLSDEELAVIQIAAGHRRLRAFHRLLQLGDEEYATFPVEVMTLDDRAMSDIAWEENEKRSDLTAIEKAEALQRAIELFGYTQAAIGERWGLSQPAVGNLLRLLQLPREAQDAIRAGQITERHGRALLTALGKSKRIYEQAAAEILPPVATEQSTEKARELLGRMRFNDWTDGLSKDTECGACGRKLRAEKDRAHNSSGFVDEEWVYWSLCTDCYRAASGWEPPSTAEAERIIRETTNRNSRRLSGASFPRTEEIGGAKVVQHPTCEGCPATEVKNGEPWCLDSACFEFKEGKWKDLALQQVRERLVAEYGPVGAEIEITNGYNGQDLRSDSIDKDLVEKGICVPGKCPRLRLKQNEYGGGMYIKPFSDLPYVWSCNNSQSHSACQRKYLESVTPEEDKSEQVRAAEGVKERKETARELVEQAAGLVLGKLNEKDSVVWRGVVEKIGGRQPALNGTFEECLAIIARQLISDQVDRLTWKQFWDRSDSLDEFEMSVSSRMRALGLSLPTTFEQLEDRLLKVAGFVMDKETKGEELYFGEANTKLGKIKAVMADAVALLKQGEIDQQQLTMLGNTANETADMLWEAARSSKMDLPQDWGVISWEIGADNGSDHQ